MQISRGDSLYNYIKTKTRRPAPSERYLFRLQVYKRVGISLKLKYLKGWGNFLIRSVLYGCKRVTKAFRFRWTYSHFKDSAFTAVEMNANFSNIYVKGEQCLKGRKGVPFLSKMAYITKLGVGPPSGLDYPLTPRLITKQSNSLRDLLQSAILSALITTV